MAGLGKKRTAVCSVAFAGQFDKLSKAALIDALWCACQLGTNETAEEIEAQAARNAKCALAMRGDKLPKGIAEFARRTIDSDGDYTE